MRICFFGQQDFFDYFQIGGFESFIRRLALGLINSGNNVDYILYGSSSDNSRVAGPNLLLHYFRDFQAASQRLLAGAYDHVFRVRLSRRDRLKYLLLSGASSPKPKWHHIFLIWPESIWKRVLAIAEGRLSSPNGLLVCVSPRQYLALAKFFKSACQVLPPVPEGFFLTPENKGLDRKIRITFLGNLTRDKFIDEIITLFNKLGNSPHLHFSLYGTHDPLNRRAVETHNWLKAQQNISYMNIDMKSYSPDVDNLVRRVLRDTDVFIQPYRTLDNTLDMPLLLLEAMASLCAVVTTPLGSVAEVYGESKFIIPAQEFSQGVEPLLKNLTHDQLVSERKRIYARNKELNFNMACVMEKFVHHLNI